jgi:molybdopterin molybdotransferase
MSCSDAAQKLISIDEAFSRILENATGIDTTESVPLNDGLGRVLAKDVCSAIDVPGWDNSAMDGYAIRYIDLEDHQELPVLQRIPAGTTGQQHQPGSASRIFTGAPVPPGADTVVMQEMVERNGNVIRIKGMVMPGANIRRAGEDISHGSVVIQQGTVLHSQHIGLAASVGADMLSVRKRLRVAIFTTGDELTEPGNELQPGKIYNSNHYLFTGLLSRLGCEIIDFGNVADDYEQTCRTIEMAAEQADLILSSGGVSVGEEDHVKNALESMGKLELWRIAVRPGKPLAFGNVMDVPFIGVPGNPVSLFVTFSVFVRPFILRSMGVDDVIPREYLVPAAFDWESPDKRTEYMRACITKDDDGLDAINVYPSRSSGVLSSVTWADGLVVINPDQVIHKGENVRYIPFSSLYQ